MGASYIEFSHVVPATIEGVRLSDYAAGIFQGLDTRAAVKKAIKRKQLYVNDRSATTAIIMKQGDLLYWHKPVIVPLNIFRLDADVVFEDDYFAIVRKPAGVVVSGNLFRTLENALPGIIKMSPLPDALPAPHAIHRLDSDTSGLVIIAKTSSAHLKLSRLLENGEITKTYLALVIGTIPESGSFTEPLDGKNALTRFVRLNVYQSLVSGTLSLVHVFPETGRTHQIRKHLSGAGFPILGDKLYCDPSFLLKHKGLFLCATSLEFIHPFSGERVAFSIESPSKFRKFPEAEERRYEKYKYT
jgi:23S rRNA pseudouridine1911/1915/1917 synthase